MAFNAAFTAISEVVSFLETKCRNFIPDRFVIHSSEVSINLVRSSFEYLFFGKYEPTPVNNILLEIIISPFIFKFICLG